MVPYVDAVVTLDCDNNNNNVYLKSNIQTGSMVMRILWFVCMLRWCEGDGNAGVGDGDGVVVSTGHMWVVHVVQVLCLAQLTC